MPTFSGKCINETGQPNSDVKVLLTVKNNPITGSAISDANGEWRISINTPVDSKDVTLTFSKEEYVIRDINNPSVSSTISTASPDITKGGGKLKITGEFPGGKYYFNSIPDDFVKDKIRLNSQNLEEFIAAYNTKKFPFEIHISGSESLIPNTDNEEYLENGEPNPNFKKDFGNEDLPLAKRRAKYLKQYVISQFKYKHNKDAFNSRYKESTYSSGPNYSGGDKNKYTQYQYVTLYAKPLKPLCDFIKNYDKNREQASVWMEENVKSITINPYILPDRLGFQGVLNSYYSYVPDKNIPDLSDDEIWGLSIYLTLLYFNNFSTDAFLDDRNNPLEHKVYSNNEIDILFDKFLSKLKTPVFERFGTTPRKVVEEQVKINPNLKNVFYLDNPLRKSLAYATRQNPKLYGTNFPEGLSDTASVTGFEQILNYLKEEIFKKKKLRLASIRVEKADITKVTFNLDEPKYKNVFKPGDYNIINGISGYSIPNSSVWEYKIC